METLITIPLLPLPEFDLSNLEGLQGYLWTSAAAKFVPHSFQTFPSRLNCLTLYLEPELIESQGKNRSPSSLFIMGHASLPFSKVSNP